MIQGARYRGRAASITAPAWRRRPATSALATRNPSSPTPLHLCGHSTHGDHVHYAGTKGPHAGKGRSDAAGGGHAHAGLLVYQGDSFPAEYRGKIFMNNIHGQPHQYGTSLSAPGSGFVGKHGADFINFNDRWSQIINLSLAGRLGLMIDWYDKNQCHHNDVTGTPEQWADI